MVALVAALTAGACGDRVDPRHAPTRDAAAAPDEAELTPAELERMLDDLESEIGEPKSD